jgi:DNA-binding CsgD family transcriptional regulator
VRHISFVEAETGLRTLIVLSSREREVLYLVAKGLLNKEIAHKLNISFSTARTIVAHLLEGLEVRNRVELSLWRYQNEDALFGLACKPGLHPAGCKCGSDICCGELLVA